MVSISSLQADNDTKKQRLTLEKAKVVNLSKQLQIRLQYARLKVQHGWQRQSLNEVENLYFHHSTLKGKSKASSARPTSIVAPPLTPSITDGSSPKDFATSSSRKTAFSEPRQGPPPMTAVASPPPAVVVSPPPTASSPLTQGTSTPPLPHSLTPAAEASSPSHTPNATPIPSPASDAARSASSVLSAFSQNYTVSQQQLSRDFSTLSPFVTASPFVSPSVSFAAPSSFVAPAPFPPQQTLAYPPSPFAPPPPSPVPPVTAASIAAAHFPELSYPMIMQTTTLSTFPPFPAPQPPPSPSHSPTPAPVPATASSPSPNAAPAPPSQRAPARRTPTPVPPTQTKPPLTPSSSSFRPSKKTFDIPTAPGPLGGTAGVGTLGVQSATTPTLTYDSFWSSHVSTATTAGGGGVGGWRRASAAGGTLAPAGTATSITGGGGNV